MRQVLSVSKPRRFPSFKQWQQLPNILSKAEKHILQIATLLIVLSAGSLVGIVLFSHRVEMPTHGGEYTEALVGEPQLINPLYATTNDVDVDLVSLIYSGLFKWIPGKGLVLDLAESVKIDETGTKVTVAIRKNATFQNGDPLNARDVVFTIDAIKNPAYRSPLYSAFKTVSIAQDDDQTVSFTLEKAQASFLQNLTVGILPANVWSEILPQNAALTALNLQPIGSGPYQFEEFAKDKKGSVRSYTLKPFEKYYAETGKIDRLNFKFYSDTASALEALTNKFVEGVNMVPFEHRAETGQNRSVMLESPFLSRESVLFFNQKTNVWLQKKPVREAIALAIDKTFLTHTVLEDQARPITGPLLPGMSGYSAEPGVTPTDLEKSKTLLTDSGIFKEETKPVSTTKKEETTTATETTEETVVRKPNQFTLTTVNNEESLRVADAVKKQLESVGLQIDIVSLPASTLYDKVIAPRDFELLLTTVMYDADLDPSIFWHSSTNTATSLNIVDYKNTEVDKLLESAQVAISDADRETAYKTFQEKLLADIPAVFLYQSTYVYAVAKKIQNVAIESIRIPSDRFANINEWYIKTKKTFR